MYTRYVLRMGDSGIAVNKIQAYLNMFQRAGYIQSRVAQDGLFGPRTQTAVREFQAYARLNPDGIIGSLTWDAIFDTLKRMQVQTNIPVASASYYLSTGNYGIEVWKMQEYLNEIADKNPCMKKVVVDGEYGNAMRIAVQQFQYLYDLVIDGIIGKATWDEIINERNGVNTTNTEETSR